MTSLLHREDHEATPQYHDVDRELSPDRSLIPRLKEEMFIEYHDALIYF